MMQQLDYRATEYGSHYSHTRVLTFETTAFELRRLVENGLLFLLISAVWGVLLYLALTSVL
jgi:hypothetical protein